MSNSKHRALVTPSGRGKGSHKNKDHIHPEDKTHAERHTAMAWAQRLKRVFNIDISTCEKCQGPVRIIACIENQVVIRQLLAHLNKPRPTDTQAQLPPERAPPRQIAPSPKPVSISPGKCYLLFASGKHP